MKQELLEALWRVANGAAADALPITTGLSEDDALSLQLALLERWSLHGDALGGWKVGFTSGSSRAAAPRGFRPFGFILKSRIVASGARIERRRIRNAGVENELCFVMAEHLTGAAVSAADARAAVRGVAPAFVINETRLGSDADTALRVADDLSQWGIAVGAVVTPVPSAAALDALEVALSRDGETVQRQNAHGHIEDHFESIASLVRLFNHKLAIGNNQVRVGLALPAQSESGIQTTKTEAKHESDEISRCRSSVPGWHNPPGPTGYGRCSCCYSGSFWVVYLIIGGFLFRNNKIAYYFGAIVPLIGLCVGPVILTNPPIVFVAFHGAIEIVVVVSCFFLIKRMRSA